MLKELVTDDVEPASPVFSPEPLPTKNATTAMIITIAKIIRI